MMARMDEEPRTRLGRLMRERRHQLGLSEREAAKRAGIARNTWAAAEEGTRQTAESKYGGIERALQWAPGTVDRVLRGGDPLPLDEVAAAESEAPLLPPDFDLEHEIDRVSRLENVPAQTKLQIIRRLLELHEQAQAERPPSVTHRRDRAG